MTSEVAPGRLFDQIPLLARSPRTIEELPGGLTNRNYKVATPAGTFVARVALPGTELLAIDRDTEYRNSVTAAASGAGAPVLGYYPEHGVLVLGYLEGRTLTSKDVADPALIPRIAAACRRLHSGGRFGNEFNMFAVQARYAEIARSRGFAIPAGYHDYAGQFQAARAALEASATGTVPCNNDLLAANLIDDGQRIWLIDYEYSGNNDPCFELGNIVSESRLPAEAAELLVSEYYGGPYHHRIARAILYSFVAPYGWTLWGAIQHAVSPLSVDFWSWAMERFEAAAAGFSSANFGKLLDDVTRDD